MSTNATSLSALLAADLAKASAPKASAPKASAPAKRSKYPLAYGVSVGGRHAVFETEDEAFSFAQDHVSGTIVPVGDITPETFHGIAVKVHRFTADGASIVIRHATLRPRKVTVYGADVTSMNETPITSVEPQFANDDDDDASGSVLAFNAANDALNALLAEDPDTANIKTRVGAGRGRNQQNVPVAYAQFNRNSIARFVLTKDTVEVPRTIDDLANAYNK